MILNQIQISNVRNIIETKIHLGDHLNIFYGENGSGKTSILEAIYLLSSGKSFRTRQLSKIIQENKKNLTLFGKLVDDKATITIGLDRSVSKRKMQVNGESVKTISTLAKHFPVLIITQDSHKLFDSGPLGRRQYLDWGLFHVEHSFLATWSNFRKLLKNRNLALANNATVEEILAWNQGLSTYGEYYTNFRISHISELQPLFHKFASQLLGDHDFELIYKQGWSSDISYLDCLNASYSKDKFSGRTTYGPHRSDLTVNMDGRDVKDHVSRGQQKMLVYALYFSQVTLLKEKLDKDTLILLDDLGAELDIEHAYKLLLLVSDSFSQACITTANLESLPLEKFDNVHMFHVKHGTITH